MRSLHLEVQGPTTSTTSKKLRCGGRTCVTCAKCRDWHFTGDGATWDWIRNYMNWSNDDWQRWRHNCTWKLYERADGASCTSASQGRGSTYDDPIFGGHHVVHSVNVFPGMEINTSHDFLFVGDHIASNHRIISSVGDLCVCNVTDK